MSNNKYIRVSRQKTFPLMSSIEQDRSPTGGYVRNATLLGTLVKVDDQKI